MSGPAREAGFSKVGEDEVFAGFVFRVGRARFLDPAGEGFERFIVHHPGAVAVVPVDDGEVVTLIRQFRPALGRTILEVPAGTCDVEGEPAEATARRELAEETGLRAERLETLVSTHNTPGLSDQRTTVFLATGLTPCATDRSGVEERWMTVEHVRLDRAIDLVREGGITDETTALGLLLAREALARRG